MRHFGIWGPIVLILAFVVQMFLFVVPNVLLMVIAIAVYGPLWGSLICLVGVFGSSSLGFLIGRSVGTATLHKFFKPKTLESIGAFINRYGVPAIAITRLSSLSNDSLSIVAGLLRMTYWKYILATLSGITPLIVLVAIYGEAEKIETALIWIAGFSLAGLVAYVIIDKRRQKRKKK